MLTPEHFDFSKTRGKILHLGLLGLHRALDEPWQDEPSGWVAVLKAAREYGLLCNLELVSIDPRRLREVVRPCLDLIDLLVIDEYELGALADMPVTGEDLTIDADRVIAAARYVMSISGMELLVVHYPQHAIALHKSTADEEIRIVQRNSFAVPDSLVAGAVGAGDAFAAGLLYAVHTKTGHWTVRWNLLMLLRLPRYEPQIQSVQWKVLLIVLRLQGNSSSCRRDFPGLLHYRYWLVTGFVLCARKLNGTCIYEGRLVSHKGRLVTPPVIPASSNFELCHTVILRTKLNVLQQDAVHRLLIHK